MVSTTKYFHLLGLFSFAFLFGQPANVVAQQEQVLDLEILNRDGRIVVPFTLENNFIVVDIFLDNMLPLRFIVDTGAEHTVVLDKGLTDVLGVDYRREFDISGADMDTVLTAYLATGVTFRMANSLIAKNRSMLVLKENYFRFERITGTSIHGIIGGDFLGRFVVEFDYRNLKMTLHDPSKFKLRKKFQKLEADFVRNRAFLKIPLSVDGFTTAERRLLLDSGAGLFLLLYTADNDSTDLPLRVIPTQIANGLGGAIQGNVGRAKRVVVGDQDFGDVVTYFQNIPEHIDSMPRRPDVPRRDGIVGNALLKRFQVIIDYVRKVVYIHPTRRWKRPVDFDKSGLQVAAGGRNLHTFLVTDVLPGSPAHEAGLQVGDRIKRINGTPSDFLTLGGIFNKLEGKVGKRIKIVVKRPTGQFKFEFKLRDLI